MSNTRQIYGEFKYWVVSLHSNPAFIKPGDPDDTKRISKNIEAAVNLFVSIHGHQDYREELLRRWRDEDNGPEVDGILESRWRELEGQTDATR